MTKEQILENGTTDYAPVLYSIEQYAQGNCPMSSVESTIKAAMDEWAKIQVAAALASYADTADPITNAADAIRDIHLSDIDAPTFTHTAQFREHFDFIKKRFIEILEAGKTGCQVTGKSAGKEVIMNKLKMEDIKDGLLLRPNRYEEQRVSMEWTIKYDLVLPDKWAKMCGQEPEYAFFVGPLFNGEWRGVHFIVNTGSIPLLNKLFSPVEEKQKGGHVQSGEAGKQPEQQPADLKKLVEHAVKCFQSHVSDHTYTNLHHETYDGLEASDFIAQNWDSWISEFLPGSAQHYVSGDQQPSLKWAVEKLCQIRDAMGSDDIQKAYDILVSVANEEGGAE